MTEDDLPDYLEVVVAKRKELAPGLETGANGEGTEEQNSDLPESFDVVSVSVSEELAPGLENGANGNGTEEESESLPESLDVVAVKRAKDTLVDGYVLHKNQMTNPPDMVKRDENHDGSFNVGDLVDLEALEQQVASKFTNDPNDLKTEEDIPGQALNPEDFFQADMVKEIAMDFKEDPILLAGQFEVCAAEDIQKITAFFRETLPMCLWMTFSRSWGMESHITGMRSGDLRMDARASIDAFLISRDSWRRWPDATIPYVISSEFSQVRQTLGHSSWFWWCFLFVLSLSEKFSRGDLS